MSNQKESPLRVLYGEVFISGSMVLNEKEFEPSKRSQLIERLKNFINNKTDNPEWHEVEPTDGERMRDINWKMVHEHHPENYAIIRSAPATEQDYAG